jgi:hypothetical protein
MHEAMPYLVSFCFGLLVGIGLTNWWFRRHYDFVEKYR